LTTKFSTVSLTPVPSTTLTGVVVDPGPDLEPGTFDDVRVGADGLLMTGDDLYLHPIAGATVEILGMAGQTVLTAAQGRFTLQDVPAGDVKLRVDGRTATNSPAAVFFPEMVMDLTIKPGVVNTVMGSMGTAQQAAAQASVQAVYLPRIQSTVLQNVNTTA